MATQKPKSFRPWQPEQTTLLPPSPREWLSKDHQMYFLLDLDLLDELALSEILIPAQAKDPRGEKGFDPRMLTMLLLYTYCVGIVSSRRIERACHEELACRVLTGNQQPDYSCISEFRGNPPPAPAALQQLAHHQQLLRRLHRTPHADQSP
ncbi:transposase [Cyanobium sp. Morenito 9A2]|uniref:transposase n=1 Tax=Cyanobium sp. Morenito 9A2 TaxID=2823718 RepID=UPI0020CEA342|nr:transposase [Cyanobium sp. Morenito 9A2]MCP9850474.1 transposase [Cyanobium sp. Morenito 9A2]